MGDPNSPYFPYTDPKDDTNYTFNQTYVTPLLSGAISSLVVGSGTIDLPLVGSVSKTTGTTILTALSTYIGETMEYYIHPWFRIASYRGLGLQVGAPIYSGVANVGMHILSGNNEGVDPLLFTPITHYAAKAIANRFIFPSKLYNETHPNYLPTKYKDAS